MSNKEAIELLRTRLLAIYNNENWTNVPVATQQVKKLQDRIALLDNIDNLAVRVSEEIKATSHTLQQCQVAFAPGATGQISRLIDARFAYLYAKAKLEEQGDV